MTSSTGTTGKTKASTAATETSETLRSGDVVDDLTGFDEQAIKAHFGATVGALSDDESPQYDSIGFLRACLFAHYRQTGTGGKTDAERFHAVQSMRLGDLKATFRADEDDDDDLPGAPGKSDAAGT